MKVHCYNAASRADSVAAFRGLQRISQSPLVNFSSFISVYTTTPSGRVHTVYGHLGDKPTGRHLSVNYGRHESGQMAMKV